MRRRGLVASNFGLISDSFLVSKTTRIVTEFTGSCEVRIRAPTSMLSLIGEASVMERLPIVRINSNSLCEILNRLIKIAASPGRIAPLHVGRRVVGIKLDSRGQVRQRFGGPFKPQKDPSLHLVRDDACWTKGQRLSQVDGTSFKIPRMSAHQAAITVCLGARFAPDEFGILIDGPVVVAQFEEGVTSRTIHFWITPTKINSLLAIGDCQLPLARLQEALPAVHIELGHIGGDSERLCEVGDGTGIVACVHKRVTAGSSRICRVRV